MRATRRPPAFVGVLVWTVAGACLLFGALKPVVFPSAEPAGPSATPDVETFDRP